MVEFVGAYVLCGELQCVQENGIADKYQKYLWVD
jgi:hypothetical protein